MILISRNYSALGSLLIVIVLIQDVGDHLSEVVCWRNLLIGIIKILSGKFIVQFDILATQTQIFNLNDSILLFYMKKPMEKNLTIKFFALPHFGIESNFKLCIWRLQTVLRYRNPLQTGISRLCGHQKRSVPTWKDAA